jgi:hypothetical protein
MLLKIRCHIHIHVYVHIHVHVHVHDSSADQSNAFWMTSPYQYSRAPEIGETSQLKQDI